MNDLTSMRLCFAPKDHNCGYNDDEFLTLAFQQGKVLTTEDFVYEWQNKGGEQFKNYELRLLPVYDTCWEFCHYCNNEVELKTKWEVQTCPICGHALAPCNLCYPYTTNCASCPLSKECDAKNEAFKDADAFWAFKQGMKERIRRAIDALEDDANIIDVRISRSPYHPVKDMDIFPICPPNYEEMWDFIKDADEWYADFYENFAGENCAEYMDITLASN